MSPRVWIVSVNFNGLEDTRKCLSSLSGLASEAHVVVVDNGSVEDPSAVLAAEFPKVFVLRRETNGGWSGGNNAGIRFALDRGADFVLLLNNDTVVHPELVSRLLTASETYSDFGIIGPIIQFMDEPELTMTDGVRFNRPDEPGFFQRQPVSQRERFVEETDIVNGCCMMIRAKVFERIGPIDDRFFLIHEESDLCLRAYEAGWKCGVLAEPLVWHKGSMTFKRSGKRWQRYYDTRNLSLLLAKHQSHLRRRRGGRSERDSYLRYLRYAYHRWCHEIEDRQPDGADAVLEGLVDAAVRRYGAYAPKRRLAVPLLRFVFKTATWVKPPRPSSPPPAARQA